MTDLEVSIQRIIDKVEVIPPSRGFWVNRTDDGKHYDNFNNKGIIGLDIDDIKVSELDAIRKSALLRSNRVDGKKAQKAINEHFKSVNARKLREELDVRKKTTLQSAITRRANQVHHFVFSLKKGDYVAIPSSDSEFISIGRVEASYIEDSGYLPIQRSVIWIGQFKKVELDPVIFKAFSSHLAFYDISKYKDVILRTLYDFYLEGDEGNFVLNLGTDGKISFRDESRFLHTFDQLFSNYIETNNLGFDLSELGTIVNLNSKGKRKLFGRPTLAMLAALYLTVSLEGDSMLGYSYGADILNVVTSMNNHQSIGLDSLKGTDLKDAAIKMNVDRQDFFNKILNTVDSELDSLKRKNKKINNYY